MCKFFDNDEIDSTRTQILFIGEIHILDATYAEESV